MSPIPRATRWIFPLSLLALLFAEAFRVYWIMPFPGSQVGETIGWAYGLHRAIWPLRIVLGAILLWSGWTIFAEGTRKARIATAAGVVILGAVAWQTNGPMSADAMFRQPETLRFATAATSALSAQALVLGLALSDASGAVEAKAYPVRYLGYHHQVRDSVAGRPVMVTYCTVCRSGRVFSPEVRGEIESFRLVGMDHWNAMFEDTGTGSWWRQATGEAVAGPLSGERLVEIPSRQMTWAAWRALHPGSTAMESDPAFADEYADLDGFEEGTREGKLTGRNLESWQEKSWVVGVVAGDAARAFDWNELERDKVIADRIGETPLLLTLGADGASYYAFDARPSGTIEPLDLVPAEPGVFEDRASGARWSADGLALDGPRAGERLTPLGAYQEFWHSWRTFRPESTVRSSAR